MDPKELKELTDLLDAKFRSGNSIDVSSTLLNREEYFKVMKYLKLAAQAMEPVVCLSPCEKHQGLWYTFKVGSGNGKYQAPIVTKCPICEGM